MGHVVRMHFLNLDFSLIFVSQISRILLCFVVADLTLLNSVSGDVQVREQFE